MKSYSSAHRALASFLSVVLLAGSFLPAISQACSAGMETTTPSEQAPEACLNTSSGSSGGAVPDGATWHAEPHQEKDLSNLKADQGEPSASEAPSPCLGPCCTVETENGDARLIRASSVDLEPSPSVLAASRADVGSVEEARLSAPLLFSVLFEHAVSLHVWTATFLN